MFFFEQTLISCCLHQKKLWAATSETVLSSLSSAHTRHKKPHHKGACPAGSPHKSAGCCWFMSKTFLFFLKCELHQTGKNAQKQQQLKLFWENIWKIPNLKRWCVPQMSTVSLTCLPGKKTDLRAEQTTVNDSESHNCLEKWCSNPCRAGCNVVGNVRRLNCLSGQKRQQSLRLRLRVSFYLEKRCSNACGEGREREDDLHLKKQLSTAAPSSLFPLHLSRDGEIVMWPHLPNFPG